jgi:hypothetical protein
MATAEWIESAARERKPVIASDIARSGQHLLYQPTGAAEEEAAERAGAIQMNRCLSNRHECPGLCDRPEHARDVAAGLEVLEALGLIPYIYAPGDAETLLCERCQQRKDPAEFSPNSRHTSRRAATCKACCAANENGTR